MAQIAEAEVEKSKPQEPKKDDEDKEKAFENVELTQLSSHDAPKQPKASSKVGKHAILMTGATHARELISTSLNIYQLLQLLQKGEVQ